MNSLDSNLPAQRFGAISESFETAVPLCRAQVRMRTIIAHVAHSLPTGTPPPILLTSGKEYTLKKGVKGDIILQAYAQKMEELNKRRDDLLNQEKIGEEKRKLAMSALEYSQRNVTACILQCEQYRQQEMKKNWWDKHPEQHELLREITQTFAAFSNNFPATLESTETLKKKVAESSDKLIEVIQKSPPYEPRIETPSLLTEAQTSYTRAWEERAMRKDELALVKRQLATLQKTNAVKLGSIDRDMQALNKAYAERQKIVAELHAN